MYAFVVYNLKKWWCFIQAEANPCSSVTGSHQKKIKRKKKSCALRLKGNKRLVCFKQRLIFSLHAPAQAPVTTTENSLPGWCNNAGLSPLLWCLLLIEVNHSCSVSVAFLQGSLTPCWALWPVSPSLSWWSPKIFMGWLQCPLRHPKQDQGLAAGPWSRTESCCFYYSF